MDDIKNSVTVVMVTYNAVNEVSKTIDSIVPHLDSTHELIVVDGGSNDGTLDVLRSYSHKSYRFVSEQDEGIYDAMNKGVSLAKGKWITFINCGDQLIRFPDSLDPTNDIECFAVETEQGCIYPKYNWTICYHNTLPHQGIYYNKNKFIGFDKSLKIFADYDYNLKLYFQSAIVSVNTEIVAFHSLVGVSNSINSASEWKHVVYANLGLFWLCVSMLYFYYSIFRKCLRKIKLKS